MKSKYLTIPLAGLAAFFASDSDEPAKHKADDAFFKGDTASISKVISSEDKFSGIERFFSGSAAYGDEGDNGNIDYKRLAQEVVNIYNNEIRGTDIHKKADFIKDNLGKPLDILSNASVNSFDEKTRIVLGEACNNYGVILRDIDKDIYGAIKSYKKAVEFNPKSYKDLAELASVYFSEKNDIETARKYIKKAYSINSDDVIVKIWHNKLVSMK